MKNVGSLTEGNCIRNHNGGRGEIGSMLNHTVYQAGTIGTSLLNHVLDDGAPKASQVIQFACGEEALARKLGLYSYPIRSYALSNPGDIFQIGEELIPGLHWLKDHYDRIGIHCAEKFLYHYDFLDQEYPNHKLSVFFFGEDAHRARPDTDRLQATRAFNNKNEVIALAQTLRIRTPKTEMYSSVDDVMTEKYRAAQYPLVVKIGNSVSGLGFEKCCDHSQLVGVLEKIAKIPVRTPFQIQEYLHGAIFLSAQWWIYDAVNYEPITGTQNFIEGDANHAGNWGGEKIPHTALFTFSEAIVKKAASCGLRDWVGFDIAFHEGSFYLIECNPRYTGAAYPFVAVQKLFGRHKSLKKFWAHRNYSVSRSSIDGFHLNGLEYDASREEGWIVINPGPLTVGDGKIGMLWVGAEENYVCAEDKLNKALV